MSWFFQAPASWWPMPQPPWWTSHRATKFLAERCGVEMSGFCWISVEKWQQNGSNSFRNPPLLRNGSQSEDSTPAVFRGEASAQSWVFGLTWVDMAWHSRVFVQQPGSNLIAVLAPSPQPQGCPKSLHSSRPCPGLHAQREARSRRCIDIS